MLQYRLVDAGWGSFGFVVREKRLIATSLPAPKASIRRRISQRWPDAVEGPALLPRFCKQVMDYFSGRHIRFAVDVDLSDLPPFFRAVLEQCRRIPYGELASYQDLARAAGRPTAVRAVGGAMAHNPLPLVVPCHRVVRADGTIGGFSSPNGVAEKLRLLRLEGVDLDASPAGRCLDGRRAVVA